MYDEKTQSFLSEREMEEAPRGGIRWTPTQYRLNGNTGKFLTKEFDVEAKKMQEEKELDRTEWGGVILDAAYFSQKKYKEGQNNTFRTREFSSFQTDPIELLEITFGEGGATKVSNTYPNYATFKDAKTPRDPETHEPMASPYELKCALYVFIISKNETVKYVIRGSTLSNWFNFSRKFIDELPEHPKTLKQVKTLFSSTKETNQTSGKEYFTGSFKAHSLCSNEEMQQVIEAWNKLNTWKDSWKKKVISEMPSTVISETMPKSAVHVLGEYEGEEEIDLSSIPF